MLTRRALLALAGAAGGALALPVPASALDVSLAADPVADEYHRLLLVHTRWVQQQWDPAIGAYRAADFRFAAVLGNAVLLTTDGYDAGLAGVDAAVLRGQTLATITRFAATNRLAGGTEWGRRLFWDSTFELYFVLAARLLWAELDAATRSNVDAIARGQAAYAYGLGTGNDPLSGSWTPNGSAAGTAATPNSRRWASTRRPSRPAWRGLRPVTPRRAAAGAVSCSGRPTPAGCPPPTAPTRP